MQHEIKFYLLFENNVTNSSSSSINSSDSEKNWVTEKMLLTLPLFLKVYLKVCVK